MRKYSIQDLWIRVILFFTICVILIFSFQGFALRIARTVFNNGNAFPANMELNIVRAMNGIVGIALVYVFLLFDRQKMNVTGFFWENEFGVEWIILSIPITLAGFIPTIIIEHTFGIVIIGELQDIIGIFMSLIIAFFAFGIGEELLFRGYIQTVIETRYSFIIAAVVSSGLFGLLHFLLVAPSGNLESMIAILFSAFAIGLTFSYAFKTTKYNLILPIAIHGFWDFFIFAFQADFTYENFFFAFIEIFASIVGG
jgi:membrane protease YdiL (CAAX protease family)